MIYVGVLDAGFSIDQKGSDQSESDKTRQVNRVVLCRAVSCWIALRCVVWYSIITNTQCKEQSTTHTLKAKPIRHIPSHKLPMQWYLRSAGTYGIQYRANVIVSATRAALVFAGLGQGNTTTGKYSKHAGPPFFPPPRYCAVSLVKVASIGDGRESDRIGRDLAGWLAGDAMGWGEVEARYDAMRCEAMRSLIPFPAARGECGRHGIWLVWFNIESVEMDVSMQASVRAAQLSSLFLVIVSKYPSHISSILTPFTS